MTIDLRDKTATILPDCMMPDGADPCLAYQELARRLAEETKNKKEFERDWIEAGNEVMLLRQALAEAEQKSAERDEKIKYYEDALCFPMARPDWIEPGIPAMEISPIKVGNLLGELDSLRQQLSERDAMLAECSSALAYYANSRDIYQDERVADYAANVLNSLPASAKANAKILMAARAQEEALTSVNAAIYVDPWSVESEKAKDIYSVACFDLCQAVRAEKEIK